MIAWIKKGLAYLSIVYGIIFTIMGLLGILRIEGFKEEDYGIWLFIFLIGIVSTYFPYKWLKKQKSIHQNMVNAEIERTIFLSAQKNNGILTITELSIESNLSIDEARHYLDLMCQKGLATPDVNSEGVIHYKFNELIK